MRQVNRIELYSMTCANIAALLIIAFGIYYKFNSINNVNNSNEKTSYLTVKVLKPLEQGKYANNFLVRINDHDYHVSINKSVHNVMFFHDINCEFCKKNKSFYPYSFSILDGYNSQMMKENYENNKK